MDVLYDQAIQQSSRSACPYRRKVKGVFVAGRFVQHNSLLLSFMPKEYPKTPDVVLADGPSSNVYHSAYWCLLNRHLLSIGLPGLDLLSCLLDGLEDGFVWERLGGFDFGGLLLE